MASGQTESYIHLPQSGWGPSSICLPMAQMMGVPASEACLTTSAILPVTVSMASTIVITRWGTELIPYAFPGSERCSLCGVVTLMLGSMPMDTLFGHIHCTAHGLAGGTITAVQVGQADASSSMRSAHPHRCVPAFPPSPAAHANAKHRHGELCSFSVLPAQQRWVRSRDIHRYLLLHLHCAVHFTSSRHSCFCFSLSLSTKRLSGFVPHHHNDGTRPQHTLSPDTAPRP